MEEDDEWVLIDTSVLARDGYFQNSKWQTVGDHLVGRLPSESVSREQAFVLPAQV